MNNFKWMLSIFVIMPSFINGMRSEPLARVALLQVMAIRSKISSLYMAMQPKISALSGHEDAMHLIKELVRSRLPLEHYITLALGILYAPSQNLDWRARSDLIGVLQIEWQWLHRERPWARRDIIVERMSTLLEIIQLLSYGDEGIMKGKEIIDALIKAALRKCQIDRETFMLSGIQALPNSIDDPLVIVSFINHNQVQERIALTFFDIVYAYECMLIDGF